MSDFEDVVQRLVDQAVEQGLPRYVEDEAVIRRVAAIIRRHHAEHAAAPGTAA